MYGAYYDLRDPAGPRIRLLAIMDTKIITMAQILLRLDTQVLRIAEINVLADEAAHAFYFGCKYQEVDIVSEVYNGHLPNIVSQTIPLQPLATNYDSGLTVCQKPLHCLHSVSIPTMKLIEYYKRLELVDFQWISQMPMVGGTDPNNALDWQGEHLFEQLCSYRSTTKYTAIADVDEFLAISNGTDIVKLLEALAFKEEHPSSFRFETVPITLPEKILSGQSILNLTSLEDVKVRDASKEERCIYRTEQTRTSQRLLCPMPTGKHCQEEMLKVEEWVLPSNKEGNVWTVV
ncbi:unnamed protein product, partial [Mesorhabditis spiculigera]